MQKGETCKLESVIPQAEINVFDAYCTCEIINSISKETITLK